MPRSATAPGLSREFPVGDRRVVLRLGDLTDVRADALVNSENHDLVMDRPDGRSVSAALRRRGGEAVARAARALGPLTPGAAAPTTAGRLAARYVIHAAVVRLKGGLRWTSAHLIRRATLSSLRCAARLGCRTVAMPAFGVGTARFPDRAAAREMLLAVAAYLRGPTCVEEVVISLLTPETFVAFLEQSLRETLRQEPRLLLEVAPCRRGLVWCLHGQDAASAGHEVRCSPAELRALGREAASLLGSGAAAELDRATLDRHARAWGERLLPPAVRHGLAAHPTGSLLLRHSPGLADLPLELLHDGRSILARRLNVARQLRGAAPEPRLAPRRERRVGRLLVVADPGQDLAGACAEGAALLDLDRDQEGVLRAELLAGPRATVARVRAALPGAVAVHFCGHGARPRAGRGWALADGVLAPEDLALEPPPAVVVNNCCPPHGPAGAPEALARAVLASGVAACVVAVHAPPDRAAAAFGVAFWRCVSEGAGPAEAVRRARDEVARVRAFGSAWACWVLFGDPDLG